METWVEKSREVVKLVYESVKSTSFGNQWSITYQSSSKKIDFLLLELSTNRIIRDSIELPNTKNGIKAFSDNLLKKMGDRLNSQGYEANSEKNQAARQLNNDIETIRKEMDIMKALVVKAQSGTPSLTADQMQEALTAVEERVNTRFQSLTQASRTLSAPIEMPPMEELTVRMVTVGTIDRLSEAMQEETKWGTWGGVFLGTLLGILTNIATGGTLDVNGIILVIVLALVAGLCGYTAWGNGKKAKVLKAKLLREDEPTGKRGVRVMSVEEVGDIEGK